MKPDFSSNWSLMVNPHPPFWVLSNLMGPLPYYPTPSLLSTTAAISIRPSAANCASQTVVSWGDSSSAVISGAAEWITALPSGMFVVFPAWGQYVWECESQHSSMHLSTPRAPFIRVQLASLWVNIHLHCQRLMGQLTLITDQPRALTACFSPRS